MESKLFLPELKCSTNHAPAADDVIKRRGHVTSWATTSRRVNAMRQGVVDGRVPPSVRLTDHLADHHARLLLLFHHPRVTDMHML